MHGTHIVRTAALIVLVAACKSQSPTPQGTFEGTVGVTTTITTGSNPRSFRSEFPLQAGIGVENGKTMVALSHPYGAGCTGEARRVSSELVVDSPRCQDAYAPGCTVTTMPLVFEIQPDGTLRSRIFVTAFANSPACGVHAGQRDDFEPAMFRLSAAVAPR